MRTPALLVLLASGCKDTKPTSPPLDLKPIGAMPDAAEFTFTPSADANWWCTSSGQRQVAECFRLLARCDSERRSDFDRGRTVYNCVPQEAVALLEVKNKLSGELRDTSYESITVCSNMRDNLLRESGLDWTVIVNCEAR